MAPGQLRSPVCGMTAVIPRPGMAPYARGMRGLYLASVWIHILAAMTWVGGMVIFVAAVMPFFRQRPDADRAAFLAWFGPRFRVVSWTCFAVLAATGAINLGARGVGIADLLRREWWSTGFGHALGTKLGLVVTALLFSALHERTASRASARWMGRALLLIGFAVTAAAVLLVRSS